MFNFMGECDGSPIFDGIRYSLLSGIAPGHSPGVQLSGAGSQLVVRSPVWKIGSLVMCVREILIRCVDVDVSMVDVESLVGGPVLGAG